jgi:NAD+ synthase/NAD+ synthase (glutamine-hydrolysing)
MKIALLQQNYVVGDLYGNAYKIAEGVWSAAKAGAELVITSELSTLGYPPRDLLLQRGFIEKSWRVLRRLAELLKDAPPTLVGIAEPSNLNEGRPLFNSAALLAGGDVKVCFRKSLLPTYDVFDEDRYFEPAPATQTFRLSEDLVGVTVCEDIWNDRDFWHRRRYHIDHVEQLVGEGADIVINISASPFTVGKQQLRESMLSHIARKHGVKLLYVNQVGGNDDLVFDGRSMAFSPDGRLIARAKAFEEDLLLVDLTRQNRVSQDDFTPESEIWRALVLGTRDYLRKCGFSRVLLGLSGGIDSSLTAAIAPEAVGPENVLAVIMPSPFNSPESIEDAEQVARNLGVKMLTIPITSIMQAFEDALRNAFEGYERDVTEENIQARIRGNILMALSNKYHALLLTTGNKSELAVGYCTIYGDMCGGLAVISDVPKTMVYRLARWLNIHRPVIPDRVLTKPPSAELRPNQKDQDTLPPYEELDKILHMHIEMHMSAEEIIAQGFDESTVKRVLDMVKKAEFKRKQAPVGIKVTDRAFGTGWRMPIAYVSYEYDLSEKLSQASSYKL